MKTAKRIAIAIISTIVLVGALATSANAASPTESIPSNPKWGMRGVHAVITNNTDKTLKFFSHRSGHEYTIYPGSTFDVKNGYEADLPEVEISVRTMDDNYIGRMLFFNPIGNSPFIEQQLQYGSSYKEATHTFNQPESYLADQTNVDRKLKCLYTMHDQSDDYKEFTVDMQELTLFP